MKKVTTTLEQFRVRVMDNKMNATDVVIILCVCLAFSVGLVNIIGDPATLLK